MIPRRLDDNLALVELRLMRWMAKQADLFRIDFTGQLIAGRGLEAVITNERTGRQGLWPQAWAEEEEEEEELPLFRKPRKVQQSLF